MDEPNAPAGQAISGKRRELLTLLKRRGEARAEELAEALEITVSAARQHLAGLLQAELVTFREEKGRPGRPAHVYRLAPAAEALFPRAYDALSRELLQDVAAEDPALLQRLFAQGRRRRVERARERIAGLDFDAQVAELAQMLDDDGYLAEWQPLEDGSYRITEHNCAIIGIAQEHGHACLTEIEFLREVLPEAKIERVAYMMESGHICAYRVSPPLPGSASRG